MRAFPLVLLLLGACTDKALVDDSAPDDSAPDDSAPDDSPTPLDQDADGFDSSADCDDQDSAVYPGAPELCNDQDDDCDGATDEDATDTSTYYADADQDGYGDPAVALPGCDTPPGAVDNDWDCDDADAELSPEAEERCDGLDNNCDGLADDADPSTVDFTSWYPDQDQDLYGDPDGLTLACEAPAGALDVAGDCDDQDAAVNPDAQEVCDSVDNDCDALTDDDDDSLDLSTVTTWYVDGDGDGYGDEDLTTLSCAAPTGGQTLGGDCDDGDKAVSPDASEVCDGVDNNCDALSDDADPSLDLSTASSWYADLDSDGYGDADSSVLSCDAPSGTVADATDCDDSSASVNPGQSEVCDDGVDNNCDGGPGQCGPEGSYSFVDSDFVFTSTSGDYVSYHLQAVDLDQDGQDDLIAGAYLSKLAGSSTGSSYLVYGPITADMVLPTEASAAFNGLVSGDNAGVANAGDGDFDDDGYRDLLVTAPDNDDNGSAAGAVYLFYGGSARFSGSYDMDSVADLVVVGAAASDGLGRDVNYVGDLNGDGFTDLVIGADGQDTAASAAGAAYVIFGSATRRTGLYTVSSLADVVITGPDSSAYLGDNRGIADAVDMDGDGLHDLWLAAWSADVAASTAGAVYLHYGDSTWASSIQAVSLDASFVGGASADNLGDSTESVGDINDDGYGDVAAGAINNDDGASATGSVYVILGSATRASGQQTMESVADLSFSGVKSNDGLGMGIGGGDLNGDGADELLLGVRGDDTAASGAGVVCVFYSPSTGTYLSSDADAFLYGGAASAELGRTLSSGDMDGDGYEDLVAGAYRDSTFSILLGGRF